MLRVCLDVQGRAHWSPGDLDLGLAGSGGDCAASAGDALLSTVAVLVM